MTNWTSQSGSVTPWAGIPAPTPTAPIYDLFNILDQSGSNILNQGGGKILFETVRPAGFQPITNPATAWS